MYETIELTYSQGVATIALNRPHKMNALSIQMRKEISSALNSLSKSNPTPVLVFTGMGKSFSSGFDLEEFKQPDTFQDLYETSSRYHRDVWNYPMPVIAAINGPALGGGFDLATLGDIRICSEYAVFGHPEIKFGAPPLYTPLRWIVGEGLARDLCLTGRRIDACEALRIGLVSEIAAPDQLLPRVYQTAASITEAPPHTLSFVKRYLTGNSGKGFEESFRLEHDIAFQNAIRKNHHGK